MPLENPAVFTQLNKELLMFLDIIPEFNGNVKTLNDFCTSVEEVLVIINQSNPSEITKKFILLTLKKKITGSAKELISGNNLNSWAELKALLIQNYEDKRNEATLLIEICDLKQNNEQILQFYKKYLEIFLLYKSKLEVRLQGNELKNMVVFGQQFATQCFIKNCKEPYRSQLSARHPKNLNDISDLITNDLQYVKNQSMSSKPVQYQVQPTKINQYQSPMTKYPNPQQQRHFNQPRSPYQQTPMSVNTRQTKNTYQPTPMSTSTRTFPRNNNKIQNVPNFMSEEVENTEYDNNVNFNENEQEIIPEIVQNYEFNENSNSEENENFPMTSSINLNP